MARMPPSKRDAAPRSARRRPARAWARLAIGGPQRVGGEQAEDVGQQQLLVLLLVIDAELDQHGERLGSFIDEALRESRVSASSTWAR